MERYKVAIVHGHLDASAGDPRRQEQLSAHVLDRLNAHRVVASFRSEDGTGTRSDGTRLHMTRRRGKDGAREDAEARAAELNADEAE